MKIKSLACCRWLLLCFVVSAMVAAGACETGSDRVGESSDSDSDSDSDADDDDNDDNDNDNDNNDDTDDENINVGSLHGTVASPNQTFPISGALVYLLHDDPPEIPSGVFNYECDEMTNTYYTLSAADGKWAIADVPAGTWKIVTRKGNFRRVREVEVVTGADTAVPMDLTTLPGSDELEGDTIPSFAVVHTEPDRVYNLLAKFGMGEVNNGALVYGTETFELYNDSGLDGQGYPTTATLFESQAALDQHHMIFLPCYASVVGVSFAATQAEKIKTFVSAGGKIYNSCCVALWIESPFPQYIDFSDSMNPDSDLSVFDIGRISNTDYSTNGNVLDADLAAWLQVFTDENPASVPFTMGYVKIDQTVDVNDGHGLEDDDGWVKPYTWVEDIQAYPGSPLMVTYNYDYGKVFYTVYETSKTGATLTPQEYVLLYVILEVGVCENLPIVQ